MALNTFQYPTLAEGSHLGFMTCLHMPVGAGNDEPVIGEKAAAPPRAKKKQKVAAAAAGAGAGGGPCPRCFSGSGKTAGHRGRHATIPKLPVPKVASCVEVPQSRELTMAL